MMSRPRFDSVPLEDEILLGQTHESKAADYCIDYLKRLKINAVSRTFLDHYDIYWIKNRDIDEQLVKDIVTIYLDAFEAGYGCE